ncbi:MAG: APC family permease [Dehalococcoidia bacterium]
MSVSTEPGDRTVTAAPDATPAGKLGVLRIAVVVIAFSAPLAVVSGYLAVVMALGNGLGAPAAFALAGVILMAFSVGYTELVKTTARPGGFYIYITAGLGRHIGLAATVIAVLSYMLLAAGTYAFLGLAASRLVADELGGPSIPWWIFVAATWLLSAVLSYRELSVSAQLIFVLMFFEFVLILCFDATVLTRIGTHSLPLEPLLPANIVSGAPGLAMLFSIGMFLGFESTAVYRDEARDPARTIPRATYLTVVVLAVLYAGSAYLMIASLGVDRVLGIALQDPAKTFPLALDRELGHHFVIAGYLLVCTSLYGAALSMHNVLSRYVLRLAERRLIPAGLARLHPKHKAPSSASLAAAGILAIIMIPFPLLGVDPNLLYARQVGVGTFGFVMLLFLAALAISVFLWRRNPTIGSLRFVGPTGLAAVCLLVVFALANRHFVDLVGTSAATADLILGLVYAIALAGVAWGFWIQHRQPQIFDRLGDLD